MSSGLVALLLLFAIAGCAAVTSSPLYPTTPAAPTKGAYYLLPKALLHVRIAKDAGIIKWSFLDSNSTQLIERRIVPDRDQLYTLDYERNALSEDKIDLSIDSDGLLKSVQSSTEDKSSQIIAKLIDTATEAAKAAALMAPGRFKKAETAPELVVDYVFAPEDVDDVNRRIKHDLRLKPEDETAPQIIIDPPIVRPPPGSPTARCARDGVCFRPVLPYSVTLMLNGFTFWSETVLMPNGAPILTLQIHRAAFVANITNVTFDQGILTEVHIEKPSEVLGFMEIPLAIAKAITSVPAEILQFKIDYSTKQQSLSEAQKTQLEAAQALIDAQRKNSTDGR